MPRAHAFIAALVLLGSGTSCKNSRPAAPVVVHVLRDPYFAADLTQANVQFIRTSPRAHSGRSVTLEAKDDVPYWDVVKRLKVSAPEVLILYSQEFVPDDPAIRSQLGASQVVCGTHSAFIPTSVSGEEREAAQVYLNFLVSHCASRILAQPTTAQREQQTEPDEHRPPCTTPACNRIKEFLKLHYCGESPFANGPNDGCDIRGRKSTTSGTKVTANYICKWNDSEGKQQCQTQGEASPEVRKILLREMRRVGLPDEAEAEKEVYFTVFESTSGWSLMAANYDHISGPDLVLCQVVAVTDQDGQVHVLRKVPLRKTNADVPEVTTWSPVDIADVDGDGNLEVVLEGDAYEDHWFEVVSVKDGSFKTIFSGLGYYL